MIPARWPGSGAHMTWRGDPVYVDEGGRLVLETSARSPQPRKAPMTLRIAIVNGSADELDELAAALDDLAVRHQRAAMAAAVELENDETLKDKRTGALAIFKTLAEAGRFTAWADEIRHHHEAAAPAETEAEAHMAALAAAGVPGSTVVPAGELGLGLPDHAPETAPTRDEVLADVAAHVAHVNGDDPDDPPSPEELAEAQAAALADGDPTAHDTAE